MTVKAKRYLYIGFGITISVVLLWFLFRNINITELLEALKDANYWWLIPNAVLIVLTMYQRAYRWNDMIAPVKKVAFSKLLAATCIGFMANNVLPLRLGEFVRAYSLAAQDNDIPKSASLANIFVERLVFDLIALLLIFGVVLYISPLQLDQSMKFGLIITIATALLGIAAMLTLALKADQTSRLLRRYLFFLPERIKDFIESVILKFSRGLEFLTDLKSVAWVSLQTMVIWILMGLSNYFVFLAFGFDVNLDASFVVLVVVSVSILVPSSPGFVGVYHAGAVLALMQYGISQEAALSCAIVLHATQYVIVTFMGFYYLKKEHLTLKTLEEKATEEMAGAGDDSPGGQS